MFDKIVSSTLTQAGPPLAAFRFLVVFFGGASRLVPNPIDVRFQSVSNIKADFGLGKKVTKVGNLIQLPEPPDFSNLRLERGFLIGPSPLRKEIEYMMIDFTVNPKNITVMLLNEEGLPVASWLFIDAYLTNYSLSGLDADQNNILIESMEFVYQLFQPLSI